MLSRKKSLLTAFVIVLIAAFMLAACGTQTGGGKADANQSAAGEAPAKSAAVSGKVTHFTTNLEDKLYIKELMADFQKKYPDIQMEFLTAPENEFDTKLQTLVAGGTPPDVTSHYAFAGFTEHYAKGLLMDLTPLMKDIGYDPVKEGIPEDLLKIYTINGKTYGIPVSAYVSLIAYNKDLFDKANIPYPTADYEDKSWTFDKLVELGQKLTIKSDDLAKSQFGLDFTWAERDMRPVYFGAKVYSDDTWTNGGQPSECYFDSPEVVKAQQVWADLMHKSGVMPTPEESRGLTGAGDQQGDPFASGKVAMSVAGSWLIADAGSLPFSLGIAAIPIGGDEKVRDVLFVDPLFILKGSKNPDGAMTWIQFMASKEAQEKAIDISGNPPANRLASEKYYNSIEGVDPEVVKQVVEGGIKYGIESYNHLIDNYSMINDIVTNEYQLIENKNEPVENVMKEVQTKITKILKKD